MNFGKHGSYRVRHPAKRQHANSFKRRVRRWPSPIHPTPSPAGQCTSSHCQSPASAADEALAQFLPWPHRSDTRADFLHDRQSLLRKDLELPLEPCNRIVLSWLGSSDRDEADVLYYLAALLGPVPSPSRSFQQVLASLEAREVWRGPQPVNEHEDPLALQFLLPNAAFLEWWEKSRQSGDLSLSSAPFRLVCTYRT